MRKVVPKKITKKLFISLTFDSLRGGRLTNVRKVVPKKSTVRKAN